MKSNMATIEQAAVIMNVSPAWVKGMIEKKQLITSMAGATTMIDAADIEQKGWVSPEMAGLDMSAMLEQANVHLIH